MKFAPLSAGVGNGRFRADLDPSWSSLNGLLGGYVAAHAVRSVEISDPERSVRTLAVSFLRPTVAGEAEIEVVPVRVGRRVSVHDVVVTQMSRPTLRARVTSTATASSDSITWSTDPLELPPPPERCEPIAPPEGVHHFDQADAVLDPDGRPFSGGARARVAGWVRPREDRPIDAAWLVMILDWFPPAAFVRVAPPLGGISIDYTVHIHRQAPPVGDGWLAGVFRADTAAGGLALEHGVVATPDGTLLAESFHTRAI